VGCCMSCACSTAHPAACPAPSSPTLAGLDPEYSTILVGPWLDLWPLTHTNKHTRAWQAFKHAEQRQQQ
jgi:hypothetical protein